MRTRSGAARAAAAVVLLGALPGCVGTQVTPDRRIDTEPVSWFELDAEGLTAHSRADSGLRRVTFEDGPAAVVGFLTRYLGEPEVTVLAGCTGVETVSWAAVGVEVRRRALPVRDEAAAMIVSASLVDGQAAVRVRTAGGIALGDDIASAEQWRTAVAPDHRVDRDGGGLSFVFDEGSSGARLLDSAVIDLAAGGRVVRLRAPSPLEASPC